MELKQIAKQGSSFSLARGNGLLGSGVVSPAQGPNRTGSTRARRADRGEGVRLRRSSCPL